MHETGCCCNMKHNPAGERTQLPATHKDKRRFLPLRYKWILFDLDGTLTDPKEGITKCVQYALHNAGIDEPDLNRLTRFIGPPLQRAFELFYGMDSAASARALAAYRERYAAAGILENLLYPPIPALLQRLQEAGAVLAVATSKPTVYARRILERFQLTPYFTSVIGSELDGRRVDKAEVIEEALRQLRVPSRSGAVMVGDREHDILGAKACGIPSIGVRYGYAAPGELERAGALYIADSIEQLGAYLLLN